MWILNHKAVAGKLYLRSRIFRWLSGSAYFVLLGTGGLHAGEAKPSSPVEWEKTVEAAKKEGKVVVSVPASAELRRGIEKVFKQRFGIDAELTTGSAATIVGKIRQESKSGAPYFDLHMGGGESMITGLLSEGILAPLEPAMVLKEIKDPNNWWGGHIWLDNAKRYIYASQAHQVELIWCNTDYAKPEEIRSLADLLNPKWSGKIGYLDPRTPGAGSSMWSFLWKLKGEEYLKKLAGQKLFLSRDQRVLAESLAKGKVALVVGLSYYTFLPFTKAGLPVKSISIPRDEIYVSGGSGNVAIIKAAPHPNATKVFVNWFLGQEGQETYSRAMGQATRRLDVDTQWTKEFGVIAAKDNLTREQYTQLENQSEEKILKTREAATELARKLLD
jgi:ABC-type Fe3+ transport system substrate-binding protein